MAPPVYQRTVILKVEKVLKNWLKKIKLNEPTISTILGGLVIIVVGMLIFNYFKTEKVEEIAPKETQKEPQVEGKVEFIETEERKLIPEGLPFTHKVEKGESLWKISQKYYTSGYNWVDIAKENNLTNPDYIEVGQELKLPKVAVKQPTKKLAEVSVSESFETPTQSITGDTYKVEKGDSLWKIAIRAYGDGYKWPEIAKVNNLINPDYIEVGQELKLPR